MIVRNTRFAKFCLLSILQFFIGFEGAYSFENKSCNKEKELCQPLSQCQWYSGLPKKPPLSTLTWCNTAILAICCPQPVLKKPAYYGDIKKPFAEDCRKWQHQVYPSCPPEGLIVAGRNAQPKEFPHMALVGLKIDDKYDWLCGGSLLNERYVLTAAHCMEREIIPNRVRLGELDYNSTDDDALIQEFVIKDYTPHPGYNPPSNYDDIAIIELDGIVQFNSYVVPICLPVTNGSENERLETAGWGNTGNARDKSAFLQAVTLDRFDERSCQTKIGRPLGFANGINPDYNICAGSFSGHEDTCQGDSGGPLFIVHPDLPCMYLEIGVTSFGTICGVKDIPGVYMRLYPYVDWIESIVWNTTAKSN